VASLRGLKSGAWIRHRSSGRFALVEDVVDDTVLFWKEECGGLDGTELSGFLSHWSIFHGYTTDGQGYAPKWAEKGAFIYERSSGVRCVILSTRLRGAWVMIEATPWLATAKHRWITVRTGNAFDRDFAHLPDRFDRPDPI